MCVADVSYTSLDADRVDSTTLLGKWCFYFYRKFHNPTNTRKMPLLFLK